VEPLADGVCSMMAHRFRSIADEVALRCAVTRKLLTDRNGVHERSTIDKWMQLVVDTSIAHAILHRRDAAEHRPQQKSCGCIVQVLDRIVLRLS
jgi:hypothetical protein